VLFDLLKKLYLAIPIGFLLIARTDKTVREWRLPVGAVVALLGIFFEASQIVIRSRTPAVTDVLMIAAGGWIGALAGHLYHSTTASNEPAS
jgi:glycopeptide antibiotics resistance protein